MVVPDFHWTCNKEWILHWIAVVYNNVCTWTHIFSCMRAQRCTTHIKRMETRGKEIDLLCRQRKQWMRRQCVCWLAGPESDEAPDSLCLTADTACTHLTPLSWESSVSPRQVFRTRPAWLWLITVTRLPLLVSSVTLCFMTGAVGVKGCSACLHHGRFFLEILLQHIGCVWHFQPTLHSATTVWRDIPVQTHPWSLTAECSHTL